MSRITNLSKYIISSLFIIIIIITMGSFLKVNNILLSYKLLLLLYFIFFLIFIVIFKNIRYLLDKHHKKLFILILIIGVIISLALIFGDFYVDFDDYASNYKNAVYFSENFQFYRPENIAMFPHLSGYIFVLSFFFMIFGKGIKTVILLNVIFHLSTSFFLYLITKKIFGKEVAITILLFFLINPLMLIWCTMPIGVVMFNFMLTLSFYLSLNLIKRLEERKKIFFYSCFIGLIFAISNLFRPVMPVFIIALVITILLKNHLKIYKNTLCSIITILLVYFLLGGIYSNILSNIVNQKLPDSKSGWSIYVGAQTEYGGLWNFEASKLVEEKRKEGKSASIIQKELFDLGVEKFKKNGFKQNIDLFKYKINTLTGKSGRYTADSYLATKRVNSFFNKDYDKVNSVIICNFFYFILILGTLITSLKMFKQNKYELLIFELYIIGILIAQMFLENSARYTISFLIPYSILSFGFLSSQNEKLKIIEFKKIRNVISRISITNLLLFFLSGLIIMTCFLRPILNLKIYSFIIILIIFTVLLLVIHFKHYFKKIDKKYIPLIIFAVTFISRIIIALVFKNSLAQISDFSRAYDNSIELLFDAEYYWTFPHWILYPSLLNVFYKIFGVSQLTGFMVNSFFVSLSSALLYLISNKIFKNYIASIMSSLLYIFWISNALYILVYTPEHVVIFILLLAIYLFLKILEEQVLKKKVCFSIVIGLILGLGVFFKDFSSVYLIAFMCVIFLKLIIDKNVLEFCKRIFLVIIITVIIFSTKNIIFSLIDINMTNKVNRNTENFSLYLGIDEKAKGYYTPEIAADYFSLVESENYDYKEVNRIVKNKFKNDIKNNLNIIIPMLEAKHFTTTNSDYIKIWLVYESMLENNNTKSAKIIKSFSNLNNNYYFVIIFFATVGIIYIYKNKNINGYLIQIIIFGSTLVLLLIESQERYRYPLETLYCILAGGGVYFIYLILCKIKKKLYF